VNCESAPKGAPEFTATTRTNHSQISTSGGAIELLIRVEELEAGFEDLLDRIECQRCQSEPPPLPRWPGDPWSRDHRPAHTCERRHG